MHESRALFRSTRARTLGLLAGLDQKQLDHRPSSGAWSIGEVADHMRRAEAFNRGDLERLIDLAKTGETPYVKQTLDVVNISFFSIPRRVVAFFELPLTLLASFVPTAGREAATLNRTIKLNNPDNVTPSPCRDRAELLRDLESSLQETEQLLEANSGLDFGRMVFDQPLFGRMTATELVRWMALHEQRHQKQICEVITSSTFPGTRIDTSDRLQAT